MKYEIPVGHSCRKMIIQQAHRLGPVRILKPTTVQSEFCKVVYCLVLTVLGFIDSILRVFFGRGLSMNLRLRL